MLLFIDGEVIEIRPGEMFESKKLIEFRHLEIINNSDQQKKRRGKPKSLNIKKSEALDGSSSAQS